MSHLDSEGIIARPLAEVPERLLRGGDVKQIYEMKGAGYSGREIARELGLARNTVQRYLKSPEAMRPKPRLPRGSKLDPYTEHIDRRMGEGLENCVVLLRELRELGNEGSYTILSEYVRPRRRRRHQPTLRLDGHAGVDIVRQARHHGIVKVVMAPDDHQHTQPPQVR